MGCSNVTQKPRIIVLITKALEARILFRTVLLDLGCLLLEAADQLHAAYICRLMEGHIDLIVSEDKQPEIEHWYAWGSEMPKLLVLVDSMAAPGEAREPSCTEVEYLEMPLRADQVAAIGGAMLKAKTWRRTF
jgi:hypothetical protein